MRNTPLTATVLALLVLSALPSGAAVLLDRIVAVVNNEAITWSELYKEMEFDLSRKLQSPTDEQKLEIFDTNGPMILDAMIDKKLQLQEARKQGINISDADVDGAIGRIRSKYSLSEDAFEDAIRQEGFDLAGYRRMLAEQIAIGRLVEREVREKINVTEEDVSSYVEQRKAGAGTMYRIRQIFIRLGEGADGEEAGRLMAEARSRLGSGEDFAYLAGVYSEDPSSKDGGDMGFVSKDNLSAEFREALDGMSPGDVRGPFKGRNGMHLIKLEDVIEVEDIIRDELFERQYRLWLRGLRERSFIEVRL